MIATILFIVFIVLMLIGVPVGVALGIGGTVAIVLSNLDTPWYGLLTVPQNFYAGLAKYPLLAIPHVRAGRLNLRPVGRGQAAGGLCHRHRGPRPRHAAAGVHCGRHVPGPAYPGPDRHARRPWAP